MSFFFLSCQQHGSAQMQTDYSAAVLNAKTLHHCFKQRISELVSKSLKNNTLHKNRHFLLICIKLPNKSVLFKYSFFFCKQHSVEIINIFLLAQDQGQSCAYNVFFHSDFFFFFYYK